MQANSILHSEYTILQVCWVAVLWLCLPARGFPVDCKEEQGSVSRCPSISQEKLLDRVIQHAELIYRVSEESCSMFDTWLLHSVLMLVQSWVEPLVYLQTTLDRYDDAPDILLNKTKWVSEKLISLEQGVVVLIRKMLDEGILTSPYSNQSGAVRLDVQPEVLESILRDYNLLCCFKKDAHKMETFLKLLKCRQTDKYNCALY
ncbi:hypothetical protein CRUP_024804 [Coryphaenoides rupestris]|nr:hypothetical protein CRUP_024804 [Coryphaenoides rupestris]